MNDLLKKYECNLRAGRAIYEQRLGISYPEELEESIAEALYAITKIRFADTESKKFVLNYLLLFIPLLKSLDFKDFMNMNREIFKYDTGEYYSPIFQGGLNYKYSPRQLWEYGFDYFKIRHLDQVKKENKSEDTTDEICTD